MLSRLDSAAIVGVEALPVQVEVDITRGLPGYFVVGLPDESVRESRERVRSAILNSGFEFPARRLTVNLAPADIRKEGAAFDLPISLGVMASQGALQAESLRGYLVAGELSLTGEVKRVRGILPMAATALERGFRGLMLPAAQVLEAAMVEGLNLVPVERLADAVGFFLGRWSPPPRAAVTGVAPTEKVADFADVHGQASVRRALEVAAAGAHNILLIGPPGAGKTMMARRLPGILPPLTFREALETTRVQSVQGTLPAGRGLIAAPPFRAPHHTVSYAGLVGGGANPRPGEISMAHNGVLFLDELPEFPRRSLESLRQPLEEGKLTVVRASGAATFPARFTLVAAMNPCPCGYATDPARECRCAPLQIKKYLGRVSGPILDRIDIHVEVPPVGYAELAGGDSSMECSAAIRARVAAGRERQVERHRCLPYLWNSRMDATGVREFCRLEQPAVKLLQAAMGRLGLSARAYGKVLRVARTIADLEGAKVIATAHLAEAIQYRSLDRA